MDNIATPILWFYPQEGRGDTVGTRGGDPLGGGFT